MKTQSLHMLTVLLISAIGVVANENANAKYPARPLLALNLGENLSLFSTGSLLVNNSTTTTTTTTTTSNSPRRRLQSTTPAAATARSSSSSSSLPIENNRNAKNIVNHIRRRRQQGKTIPPTSSSVLPAFNAVYYFIQALGRSDSNGCKHPQPSFTATCPYGAFIVAQSSKFSPWGSRLDCSQISDTQVYCVPKQIPSAQGDKDSQVTTNNLDVDDQNGVVMACYGPTSSTDDGDDVRSTDELLQVTVKVHAASYFCDKPLEVKSEPHPTVIAGGNVYQTVAIQKQCYSPDDQVGSWIFVEPTCNPLVGGTDVGATGTTATSTATTSDQGEDKDAEHVVDQDDMLHFSEVPIRYYTDRNEDILVVQGDSSTTTAANTSGRESPAAVTIAHCQVEDSCASQIQCSPRCEGRSFCNVTMPGFITTSTSFTMTPSISSPAREETCLPRSLAMNLESGQACEFNLMCSSGMCNQGICQAELLADHEVCEEDKDCTSQACGKHPPESTGPIDNYSIPQKTCCPSGETFGHEGISYCTASQPVDAACHKDAMCESNICIFNVCRPKLLDDGMECEESSDCLQGHCGHYHDDTVKICCPTGGSIQLSEGLMCSNRPADDVCENNANSLCQSNICVENTCQATVQKEGAVCDNHFDCYNGACALASADPTAPYICCPTGEYVFLPNPYENGDEQEEGPSSWTSATSSHSGLRVCTGQPEGASCSQDQDVDTLCASGLCIGGTCRANRLTPGAACMDHSDCENLVCALSSLEKESTKICCPSNNHKHVYEPETSQLMDVCTGQPLGAVCGYYNNHMLCESGSCISGVCAIDKP